MMAQSARSSDQSVLETLGLPTDLTIGIRGAGSDESEVCPMGRLLSTVNPSDRLGIAVVCVPIAGGYVYRGPVDKLHGLYFVAESVTGQLFTARKTSAQRINVESSSNSSRTSGGEVRQNHFREELTMRSTPFFRSGKTIRDSPSMP